MKIKNTLVMSILVGIFWAGCGQVDPETATVGQTQDEEDTADAGDESASEEGEAADSTESHESGVSESTGSRFADLTGTWCSHFDENEDGIPENGCADYASFLRLGTVDESPTAWAFLFECEDGAFDSEIRFENDRLFIELDTTSYTQELNSCRDQRIFIDLIHNGTDLVGKITLVSAQGESSTRAILFSRESPETDYFPPFFAGFENPELPGLEDRESY